MCLSSNQCVRLKVCIKTSFNGSSGCFSLSFWLLRRAEGFFYIDLLLPGVPLVPTIRGTSVWALFVSLIRVLLGQLARGGLYASLYDGIQMTMHVCKVLQAPYTFLLPMESLYSSWVIWLLYVLAVWLSSVLKFSRACVNFVLQYGYLFGIPEFPFGSTYSGFHMNLLILYGHMDLFAIFALRGGGVFTLLLTLCGYYTVEPSPGC